VKRALIFMLVCAWPQLAPAKTVLRMSTMAPDGTAWAREIKAFAREVAEATQNEVSFKFYFGSIAGDDLHALERVKRDQLDGVGAVGACEALAPSMRVLHLPSLYRNPDEVRHVAGLLRPSLEEEFAKEGFVYLGHSIIGQILFAGRQPIRTVADLKKARLWTWDSDTVTREVMREMGFALVPAPIDNAGSLYTDGRVDGFVAIPAAMLAFQWSAQARYVSDVKASYMIACMVLTQKSMSKLPLLQQQIIRAATAKLSARMEAVGAEQDEKLLGGLFGRQGLSPSPVSESVRAEFWKEARAAADRLGDKLVPASLAKRVNELLAEYRAAHALR